MYDLNDDIINSFFEWGLLKRLQRSGWLYIGLKDNDTIAAHSFRTALIAYLLAKKLNANTEKVLLMALIHDIEESRTLDHNQVSKKYVKIDKENAIKDQLKRFPELIEIWKEFKSLSSLEAKIVKDADLLELTLQSIEYYWQGNKGALEFIPDKSELNLDLSKQIYEKIKKKNPQWWD